MEQERSHSLLVFSGIHVAQSFFIMFYRPLFVFCSLSSGHYIVCPFRFVASDYSFGMFKLFLSSDSQYICVIPPILTKLTTSSPLKSLNTKRSLHIQMEIHPGLGQHRNVALMPINLIPCFRIGSPMAIQI